MPRPVSRRRRCPGPCPRGLGFARPRSPCSAGSFQEVSLGRLLFGLCTQDAAADFGLAPGSRDDILVAAQLVDSPSGYPIGEEDGRSYQGTPRHGAGECHSRADSRRHGYDLVELLVDEIRAPGDADVGGRSFDDEFLDDGVPVLDVELPMDFLKRVAAAEKVTEVERQAPLQSLDVEYSEHPPDPGSTSSRLPAPTSNRI